MQIIGLIVKFGDNDIALNTDMLVSEEDTKKIMEILEKEPYVTDGCSVRGTWEDIREELKAL